MSQQASWVLYFFGSLFALKVLYQFGVAYVYWRGALHGVRVNVSPVLFLDPFLIIGIVLTFAASSDPVVPWPVVLLALVVVTAASYLSWSLASRLGTMLRVRRGQQDGTISR